MTDVVPRADGIKQTREENLLGLRAEERESYRQVLEFYADPDRYLRAFTVTKIDRKTGTMVIGTNFEVASMESYQEDGGLKAREVLERFKNKSGV